MANPYFEFEGIREILEGSFARSVEVNRLFTLVEQGFEKLPRALGGFDEGTAWFAGELTGTATAYIATMPNTRTKLSHGSVVTAIVAENLTNTGAATLQVDSNSAVNITRADGSALQAGDMVTGNVVTFVYNEGGATGGGVGARWQLMNYPDGVLKAAADSAAAAKGSETKAAKSATDAAASARDALASSVAAAGSASSASGAQTAAEAAQAKAEAAASTASSGAVNVGSTSVVGVLPLAHGGTGASSAASARTNLGLKSAALRAVGNASGQIPVLSSNGKFAKARIPTLSFTDIGGTATVAQGGTGATSAAAARTALGLKDAATKSVGTSQGNVVGVLSGGKIDSGLIPSVDLSSVRNTLAIASGGTGATSKAGAASNLGLSAFVDKAIGTSSGNLAALGSNGKFPASILDVKADFDVWGDSGAKATALGNTDRIAIGDASFTTSRNRYIEPPTIASYVRERIIWSGTQAAYNAITNKDANVLYLITS